MSPFFNPEFALKSTNKKFVTRFRCIEERLIEQGKDINETSLEEMEELWQKAKDGGKEKGQSRKL